MSGCPTFEQIILGRGIESPEELKAVPQRVADIRKIFRAKFDWAKEEGCSIEGSIDIALDSIEVWLCEKWCKENCEDCPSR